MIASYQGSADLVKELLDCGAEVNRVDKVREGYEEVAPFYFFC